MLEHVRRTIRVGRAEGRKNYLLAVACGRLVWELIEDERLRRGILWAEAFADDVDFPDDRSSVISTVHNAYQDVYKATGGGLYGRFSGEFSIALAVQRLTQNGPSFAAADFLVASTNETGLCRSGASLIRDVFGNPFRPVTADPTWLTQTILVLARQMYESCDFSPMPILADALQDEGCEEEAVLSHCRGDGPHVRGCFVIDLLLGKE